jgi:hypothetical protein
MKEERRKRKEGEVESRKWESLKVGRLGGETFCP